MLTRSLLAISWSEGEQGLVGNVALGKVLLVGFFFPFYLWFPDTSEQIYISSLALLKMLKQGRAGVPMEVMGLMLGDF
eukprot:2905793-Rhodomonas_salina.1